MEKVVITVVAFMGVVMIKVFAVGVLIYCAVRFVILFKKFIEGK